MFYETRNLCGCPIWLWRAGWVLLISNSPLRAGLGKSLMLGAGEYGGEEREEMNHQNDECRALSAVGPGIWALLFPTSEKGGWGPGWELPLRSPSPPLQILVINRGLPVEGTEFRGLRSDVNHFQCSPRG